MQQTHKALLVVSFGTSYHDAKEKSIDPIERDLAQALPDRQLFRAWTSKFIIRKIWQRDGTAVDTVEEALLRMLTRGISDVLIQPTYLLNGVEHAAVLRQAEGYRGRFSRLRIADPLLASDADLQKISKILAQEYRDLPVEEAVLLMGHGSETQQAADLAYSAVAAYTALDRLLGALSQGQIFLATMQGEPSLENALRRLKLRPSTRRVLLAPFLMVAGAHACRDMAGEGDASWKSIVTRAGYDVQCIHRGLGEYEAVRRMLVKHALQAQSR